MGGGSDGNIPPIFIYLLIVDMDLENPRLARIQGCSCDWSIKHGNPPPHALTLCSVSSQACRRLLSPVALHPFGFGHTVVLLLGLHLIYIPSLLTTTQLRRQTEIHSYTALTHVTCEEHQGRLPSRCAKTSKRWPRTAGINKSDHTESSNANKRHYLLIVRSRGTK